MDAFLAYTAAAILGTAPVHVEADALLSVKTTVRVDDLEAQLTFYRDVLGLPVVDRWDGPEGRGAIVALGPAGFLEFGEVDRSWPTWDPAFEQPVANDKIDVQLRVRSVDVWAARLEGAVDFEGPVARPWGNRYLFLRDPAGLRVAIYEGDAAALEALGDRSP